MTDLARALQPAVVVLEDVDLVAEERSMGPASSPVLFDLLDAMDGAAPDADLLFLLLPTALTSSSPPWRRGRDGSTSPSRSRCRTPRPGNGCCGSTGRASRWP